MTDIKVQEYKTKLEKLENDRKILSQKIKLLSNQRYPITREINKIQSILIREDKRRAEHVVH